MKNAHFHLFLVVLIVGFGLLGYTSYRTIDFTFTSNVAAADQPNRSQSLAIDSAPAVSVPAVTESPVATPVTPTTTVSQPVPAQAATEKPEVTTTELTGEKAKLADALNRLIKDDIRMKIGSQGTRVGTVQTFLNLYEGKTSKIDNKYGEGTKNSVSAFQKSVGDEVDGLADPGTYQKMIDWLKSN